MFWRLILHSRCSAGIQMAMSDGVAGLAAVVNINLNRPTYKGDKRAITCFRILVPYRLGVPRDLFSHFFLRDDGAVDIYRTILAIQFTLSNFVGNNCPILTSTIL